MRSKIVVVIAATSIEQARKKIQQVINSIDVIELRLDYLHTINIDDIQQLAADLKKPCIFTLRRQDQGGQYCGEESTRIHHIKQLIQLKPDYFDIEADTNPETLSALHALSPTTQLIASTHHFNSTPEDLDALLNSMKHPLVSVYKIVGYANNTIDTLRMMHWVKEQSDSIHIVGHCMGEDGLASRLSGPVIGNYFTYTTLDTDECVVKHSLTQQDACSLYNLKEKNKNTSLYALIGDPIQQSIGHQFHNHYFLKHCINALYIKLKIKKNSLDAFLPFCHALPFKGISVTMPLKQAVLPLVNNETSINAVNTLKISPDHITAINTDGIGAVNALQEVISVHQKNILIIGAGGAATAIADEAIHRQANVYITNRTSDKSKVLADSYPINIIPLYQHTSIEFDVIINTIPESAFNSPQLTSWLEKRLRKKTILMNINYNNKKDILSIIAKDSGYQYISGDAMYAYQAKAQLGYWGLLPSNYQE